MQPALEGGLTELEDRRRLAGREPLHIAQDHRRAQLRGQLAQGLGERGPGGDVETLEFFAKRIGEFNETREDVKTWFDLLDVDDHVTNGGKT